MPWGQVVSHKNFLCVCGVVCFRVEFCQARLIPFFDRLAVVGGEIRIVIGFNPGEIGEALQIASRTPGCTGWRRGRNRTGSSLAWSRLPAPQSRGTDEFAQRKGPARSLLRQAELGLVLVASRYLIRVPLGLSRTDGPGSLFIVR